MYIYIYIYICIFFVCVICWAKKAGTEPGGRPPSPLSCGPQHHPKFDFFYWLIVTQIHTLRIHKLTWCPPRWCRCRTTQKPEQDRREASPQATRVAGAQADEPWPRGSRKRWKMPAPTSRANSTANTPQNVACQEPTRRARPQLRAAARPLANVQTAQ